MFRKILFLGLNGELGLLDAMMSQLTLIQLEWGHLILIKSIEAMLRKVIEFYVNIQSLHHCLTNPTRALLT